MRTIGNVKIWLVMAVFLWVIVGPSLAQDLFKTLSGNGPPIADAGENQVVNEGDTVILDGSKSYDPDGDTLTYQWSQESAPPRVWIDIIDNDKAQASFKAPITTYEVRVEGRFDIVVKLTVTDTNGLVSIDTLTVTVNRYPVANAGLAQTVIEGELVQLDGSGSYDLDDISGTNKGITSFKWQVISPVPSPVTLINPTTPNPSFEVPNGIGSITIVIELTVEGDRGPADKSTESTDTVEICVNKPPIAEAGPPQTVTEGTTVQLDGTGSYDPDNDTGPNRGIEAWRWKQEGEGPRVTFDDDGGKILFPDEIPNPTFTAPDNVVGNGIVTVTFRLTVLDEHSFPGQDTVTIMINRHPLANAGEHKYVTEGERFTLDGRASYDPDHLNPVYPDNGINTYSWVQILGTPATIVSGEDTATPTFATPSVTVDEDLTFELTVTDEHDLPNINVFTNTVIVTVRHAANVIYVDQSNQPGPGSGTPADPYTTIERAVTRAKVDPSIDVIEVKPGTYNENVDLTSIKHPIILRSWEWYCVSQAACMILPQNTIIRGVETLTYEPVVKMSEGSKLFGFNIIGGPSSAATVVLDSISVAEVAYNTIKAEADATGMPSKVLTALEVKDPKETIPEDDILIYNNVIITRAQGNKCDARGLSVIQSPPITSLIRDEKLHIVNNTIDVKSTGFAKALYVDANNLYGMTAAELPALGIVVRNNMLVIEAGEIDGPDGRSYCAYKKPRTASEGPDLPIRYNYLYVRDNEVPIPVNGRTHNVRVYAYEDPDLDHPGAEGNIILHPDIDPTKWQQNPPKYVDLADEDFHLLPDSICVDTGYPEDDYSYEPLPNGDRIDMGAYGNTSGATIKIVSRLDIIGKTRLGRTTFRYVLGLSVTNTTNSEIKDIYVKIIDASSQVTSVLDNEIFFPLIDAESTVDSNDFGDYFIIEVDRSQLITPGTLTVWFEYARVFTSERQIMSTVLPIKTSYIMGDLTGEGKIDFEDLAKLTGQWLRVGPAGSIPEDITGDGIVNLRDFAVLAGHRVEEKQ